MRRGGGMARLRSTGPPNPASTGMEDSWVSTSSGGICKAHPDVVWADGSSSVRIGGGIPHQMYPIGTKTASVSLSLKESSGGCPGG